MKKIKLLLLISVSAMIFTSCGNKYSIGNLKKNDKLLKETAIKCKQKKDEKICKNVEQAQNELAQEWWKKVKPEVSKKVDKISKDVLAGDASSSMESAPEKLWEWEAKHLSTTPQKAKEMTFQLLKDAAQKIKFEKFDYDLENVKTGQTSAGRNYAIIPAKSIISAQGQKMELDQKTLVFEDKNKWYLVNIDDKTKIILKELYSDLAEKQNNKKIGNKNTGEQNFAEN